MTWFASLIWGEEEEAQTYLAGCWLMLDGRAMRLPPPHSGGSQQNGQRFIKRTTLLIPPRRLFVLMHISNVAFLSRFPANTSVAFERAKQRKICLDWSGEKPVCEASGSSPPRCCPLNARRENLSKTVKFFDSSYRSWKRQGLLAIQRERMDAPQLQRTTLWETTHSKPIG